MNMFAAFDISAAGMNLERMRLDVAAVNLANANTTQGPDGQVFRPLRVVAHPSATRAFDMMLNNMQGNATVSAAAFEVTVEPDDAPPRLVYEPGHPDADEKGFVAYPNISPVSEMVKLIDITRAYEANVRAMNIAKSMALKALEIGGGR
jgi:flagellar basal-body rod protein FlgC